MKKRTSQSKQVDLFAHDPKRVQWHDVSLANQRQIASLLAKLFLCLAIQSRTEEASNANENLF